MIKKIARLEEEVEELLKTDPTSKDIEVKRDQIKTCKKRLAKLK